MVQEKTFLHSCYTTQGFPCLLKRLKWLSYCTCGLVMHRHGGVRLEAHTTVCVGQTTPPSQKEKPQSPKSYRKLIQTKQNTNNSKYFFIR